MSHRRRRHSSIPPPASGAQIIDLTNGGSGPRRKTVLPGFLVADRYRIERLVASGAMGEVWEATHRDLQVRVAIKTLRDVVVKNHEVLARFSREAFLLGRMRSEHVARALDFISDRRLGPVLVTEFIEGPSLASVLEQKRLTVEEAIDLAIDLVTGLKEIHRCHIVHRDVKPANVVMHVRADGKHLPVFVDLGVSRFVPEMEDSDDSLTEITTADRAVGTFEYMAPEQILNARSVTPAADLYAIGAILYRAVSGDHAFGELRGVDLLKRKLSANAPPLVTGRNDRVAAGFEEIVSHALALSPSERYEEADEMLTELSLLRDSTRRSAPPTPTSSQSILPAAKQSPSKPPTAIAQSRRPRRPSLAMAILCAVAGLGVGVAAGPIAERRLLQRWEAPPRIEAAPPAAAVDLAGQRCTLVPTAEEADGRTAYTIVCSTFSR